MRAAAQNVSVGSNGAATCVACGGSLEPTLARLGSMRCSSCRAENAAPSNGFRGAGPLRVRVGDPRLLMDLESALRLSNCFVEPETRKTLLVFVPHARDAEEARREVRIELAMWRARTSASAELVS